MPEQGKNIGDQPDLPDATLDAVAPSPARPGFTPPAISSTGGAAGAAVPAPAALGARYDIVGELGRGGMGIVYKARDRDTGELLALKVLKPEIAADADAMERFRNELLLARKITHKNVCRVYDLARFGDVAAISMEFVEGDSLRALLDRVEGVSVHLGLKILRQVMSGLEEAHAQGVVHRDLKPENIVIARGGAAKLMDFGIAHSAENQPAARGTVAGTPAYMSPEQAEGKAADQRSDVYSLGLVMFELFTGRRAAPGEFLRAQPSPRQFEPSLPEYLEFAILKCLEKDPAKRFQTIAELGTALSRQQAGALGAAGEAEPAPAPLVLSWAKADWVLLAAGILGLLYCLRFYERVLPASKMRLEVDAIAARRVAADAAARLDRTVPPNPRVQLESRAAEYVDRLEFWAVDRKFAPRPPVDSVWPSELAVWRVDWSQPADRFQGAAGIVPGRFAIVDSKGQIEKFYLPTHIPGNYRPAAPEERREMARKVAERVCGGPPADFLLRETSGGERGAFYTAYWRPRQQASRVPGIQVSLIAEKTAAIDCRHTPLADDLLGRPPLASVHVWYSEMLGFFRAVAGIFLLCIFIAGRYYHWRELWRRLPAAVFIGVLGAWLFLPSAGPRSEAGDTLLGSLPLVLTLGFAAIVLAWLGIATAEQYCGRWAPDKIASYVFLWRGRWREPAVALAFVRGALAGPVLLAAQVLLAHLAVVLGNTLWARPYGSRAARMVAGLSGLVWPSFLDPTCIGQALQSTWPARFVLATGLFNAAVIGIVFLGLSYGYNWKGVITSPGKFPHPRRYMVSSVSAIVLAIGWNLHLADFLPRPMGSVLALSAIAVLVALVAVRYDILTAAVAIASAAIWSMNYPLLVMLREVGNAAHWAIFFGWGALLALAAHTAFRPALDRARRKFVAGFR